MWIWSLKITSTGKLFFGYYSHWCPMNWLFFIWRKNVSNVRPSSMLSTTLFLILQKKSVLFIRSINTIMKFWCASSLLNNFWNLPMIIMLPFACQFLLNLQSPMSWIQIPEPSCFSKIIIPYVLRICRILDSQKPNSQKILI